MNDLWLPFEEGSRQVNIAVGKWCPPLTHISIASYEYDTITPDTHRNGIIVWTDETANPNMPVMFLITGIIRMRAAVVPFPHNIITDGEKYCPLIEGNDRKWWSYPMGYSGVILSMQDKEILNEEIKSYVGRIFKDAQ